MEDSTRAWLPVLLVSLVTPVYSQKPTAWKDPSSHHTRFVSVDQDVRLEVLDWGGSGRPVVLLAGGGDTAHVFDSFAPKLRARHHVYGITRRGFGASGYSAAESGADRLGDDVLAVLAALKLSRPVLVGHSIAGEEMSSIANRHPDRIAGLVYLEAAYPYAFDNGRGPSMQQFQALQAPQPPAPAGADLDSFRALQQSLERVNGFRHPEAELRQQWETGPDGRPIKQRDFPGYQTLMLGMRKFTAIPVPVLAIFANPHSLGRWVDHSTDPAVRQAAEAYTTALSALTEQQEKALEEGVPKARVITIPHAAHYVYLSNEAEVLRATEVFLAGLGAGASIGGH